jgi:hypothetical protein
MLNEVKISRLIAYMLKIQVIPFQANRPMLKEIKGNTQYLVKRSAAKFSIIP